MVQDQLKQLQECSWRNISFPVSDLTTHIGQRLVEHKYPDRDGSHVESLGSEPIKVNMKALFFNNISRGKTETWSFGVLFGGGNSVYDRFIKACQSKSVGPFQHPILGKFDAKCVSMTTVIDANRRDGASVDVEFIETIEIQTFSDEPSSATAQAVAAAVALDDLLNDPALLEPPRGVPVLKKPNFSFLEAMDEVTGFISNVNIIGGKLIAPIGKIKYHLSSLIFEINRLDDVYYTGVKQKVQQLKATVISLEQNPPQRSRRVSTAVLTKDTTGAELARRLNADIADLMKLNPRLMKKVIIPSGTVIRYYEV